jgi:hypothetical protein
MQLASVLRSLLGTESIGFSQREFTWAVCYAEILGDSKARGVFLQPAFLTSLYLFICRSATVLTKIGKSEIL